MRTVVLVMMMAGMVWGQETRPATAPTIQDVLAKMPAECIGASHKDKPEIREVIRRRWLEENVIGKDVVADGRYKYYSSGGSLFRERGVAWIIIGVPDVRCAAICAADDVASAARFLKIPEGRRLKMRGMVKHARLGWESRFDGPNNSEHHFFYAYFYLDNAVIIDR